MAEERITAILIFQQTGKQADIDIPLNITANELIFGLKEGFCLEIDMEDLSGCFLRAENPIALLRGNKTLKEYGLRNGTIIRFM